MSANMMRFVITVEAEISDPVAVRADGLSSAVDTEGRDVGPYVPATGDFGLISELGQTFIGGGLPALRARNGVTVRAAQTLTGQTAKDGKYPEFIVSAMPASGS
jgi:hypothetical protein